MEIYGFLSVVQLNVGADLPGHRAEVQVEVHSSHTHRFLRIIMVN